MPPDPLPPDLLPSDPLPTDPLPSDPLLVGRCTIDTTMRIEPPSATASAACCEQREQDPLHLLGGVGLEQDGLRGVDLDRLRSSNWARATASKAVTIPARSTSSAGGPARRSGTWPVSEVIRRIAECIESRCDRAAPCRRRAARRPWSAARALRTSWITPLASRPAATTRPRGEGGDRLHLRGAVLDVHDDEEARRREPARYAQ